MPNRPPKQPLLSQRVTLRLPANTAVKWRQLAQDTDLSLSDWLRRRVDGGHAVPAAKPRRQRRLRTLTADPALLRQLAAIGSNVNQIARVLNSTRLAPSDQVQWLTELAAIQRELHRLAELPWYAKDDDGAEGATCTSSS
ncbi:MobC family plasmid mobilization relaxosome protein [Vreelandella massiliensis]|uniref:MobC family plasmid mobilization relaxosome protein n=1 Tax=Vreelandella massiliensis TaxID=1816686 RepID=UPI00096A7115|nr:MobC family plasmid mobilization relaxosome protein [Halomonas massiliensis]MYL24988.1 plasmid mobilization relaxosome protein MobC [Halomonas alkaliantarctica]